ncbi:LamG-like jellyroll fold domain-containing protein [Saprospira grandis]|uniref:Secretion system C-terminal sorting domain-containing protein n=1 Tax=Saprospira grandis (strain Lewin) TaxID=984262 RepID=H6L5R3_SAPGL|nr:LamG-like jellyroll fold domain-containing protein [Saprospira grandis]AFC26313.1 hypothetical protein SGRA_3589 [Saprospira grandis str. Lewin]
MKNLSLFAFLLCFSMQGLYAQVDLAAGLEAYYPCNNSGEDLSGSTVAPNDLTVGADLTLVADRFGNADAAFSYVNNTTNGRLYGGNLGGGVLLDETHYSIVVWVKQAATTNDGRLVYINGTDISNPNAVNSIALELAGSGSTVTVDASQNSEEGTIPCSSIGSVSSDVNTMDIGDGNWHLVALTRVNDTMRLYVDTVMVSTTAPSPNVCGGPSLEFIQFGAAGFGDAGVAAFDDPMIYSRAINAQEVAAIFNLTAAYGNPTLSNDIIAEAQTAFRLFPNPTQNSLTVSLKEVEAEQYRIYNALGQLVAQGQFVGQQEEINTASLNAGFYQLVLQTTNGQQLSQQFVKQ